MSRKLGRPTPRDWYLFSLELRTMLDAGVAISRALDMLAQHSTRFKVKKAAAMAGRALAQGKSFDDALKSGDGIPAMVRAMLILGSRAGRLVETVDLLIRHYRWLIDVRRLILKGVWYPAALVILGTLVFVVRDTSIAVLKGYMGIIEALFHYSMKYLFPVIFSGFCGGLTAELLKTRLVRPYLDRVLITVPLLGKLVYKYALAVFFEILSACVESGMPITMGYTLAARATTNSVVGDRLEDAVEFLQDGESLAETLRQSAVLDKGSLGIVASGESVAEAPFLMRKLAAHYHDEVQLTTKGIITVMMIMFVPLIAVAYFIAPGVMNWLAFGLVFLFRLI